MKTEKTLLLLGLLIWSSIIAAPLLAQESNTLHEETNLQAEKVAKEQVKLKAEKERKQKYISKYGTYYGNLIYKGELAPGMSQAMVNEIWNKDFFNRSTVIRNNKTIEIWEFDKEKMQMKIMTEATKNGGENGKAALAAIFLMSLSEQYGGSTPPETLVFKNNKLTDIYR